MQWEPYLYIGSLLITGLLLFLALVTQKTCVRREMPLYSPDGHHAAVVRYFMQGAVGPEIARIWVRKTWSPIASDAYVGYAHLPKRPREVSPQVRWLVSSRLLIELVDHPPHRKHFCASQAGEITILCESVQLPLIPPQ